MGAAATPTSRPQSCATRGTPAFRRSSDPEYAYREHRRSELDYIEIQEPEDVKEAVLRLRSDPALYQAMIENGHRRAVDFTQERILDRWREFLFEHVPREAARLGFRTTRVFSPRMRVGYRRMLRDVTLRRRRGRW